MRDDVRDLLALVGEGRPSAAMALVQSLLSGGATPDDVIMQLLVPAQLEVGRRWEVGDWSVAQEHAATAVVQAALGSLSATAVADSVTRGQVVVVCVEAEWHSLAARLLAERLRQRHWEVVFLGASTPSVDLQAFLMDVRADAVVASCQTSASLVGLSRAIQACHAAGLPVVAGGAGVGEQGRHAVALGADCGTTDFEVLDAQLHSWAADPVETLAVGSVEGTEYLEVLALERSLVHVMEARLVQAWPMQSENLAALVHTLAAAVLVNDDRILADFVDWARRVIESRGGDVAALDAVIALLRAALPDHLERAVAMVAGVQRQPNSAGTYGT